jgi:choline dehydrogenase-like flavoprotein
MSDDYKDEHNPYQLKDPIERTTEYSSSSTSSSLAPGLSLNGNRDFSGQKVDVVVVGTGAGGGMAINKLTRGGLKVVALEKGPFTRWDDMTLAHDQLKNSKFNPIVPKQADYPDTYRPDTSTPTITTKVIACAENVGGGVNHYATHCYRYKPVDFTQLSSWGPVPGADLADWPISYDDLEQFYTEVEYMIGQSGDADISNPFEPPHSRPFPNPPLPRKYSDVLLMQAASRIGRTVFPMPSAANSRKYGGKDKCHLCSFCSGYMCDVGAKGNTMTAALPAAFLTGNLEVRPNSYVSRVLINASGMCTGVEYIDTTTGQYHVQECDIVIVAATAPQTTRILLSSANQNGLFPDGLGNTSGRVGKCYSPHQFSSAAAYIDRNLDNFTGIGSNSNIHDWYQKYHDEDPARNFVAANGCMLGGGANQPIGAQATNYTGTGAPARTWGLARKWYIRKTFGNNLSASCITSGLPQLTNTIDLDPVVVDKWGLPAPRFTVSTHQNDRIASQYIADRVKELFLAVEGVVSASGTGIAAGAHIRGNIHQVGTGRMGNDPSISVTNRYGQFHDVPNLFLADPSLMPTQGGGDTTLTTHTVGLWVGHHIVERKNDIPLP